MNTNIIQFQTGLKYSCRSVCDWDCVWTFTVVKRTAKFITIEDKYGKTKRVGVNVWEGSERANPLGHYSMSPSLDAAKAGQQFASWEVAA